MEEIKARLLEVIERTSTIKSFRLAPEKRIDFIPGQFLQVIFDQADRNNKELNKYLSFSSSPAKGYIEFSKRLSGSFFSQRLKELKINNEILLKAPLGQCIFKGEYTKIGFLIGGIGITPVMSIIEYINDKKLSTDVVLLYSNRSDNDIAFKPELDHWQSVNKNVKVYYIVTECEPIDKSCIFGHIDKALVSAKIADLKERMVFIFGSPKMVEAMKEICLGLGCKQEEIKTESFIGY